MTLSQFEERICHGEVDESENEMRRLEQNEKIKTERKGGDRRKV